MILRVLQYAPEATDIATAMYSGIFNIGIGGGALLGSGVMKTIGIGNIGWVGALIAVVGLTIHVLVQRKYKHTATQSSHTEHFIH